MRGGGSGSPVSVTAAAGYWTAASNTSWISVTSGGTENGNGAVNFSVAVNSGLARSGTLTIAGSSSLL